MAKIGLVKATNHSRPIEQALKLIEPDLKELVKKSQRPLIHPNLVHHNNPTASTGVEAVEAVIAWFRKLNPGAPIIVADAGYHGTKEAFRNFGYTKRWPLTNQHRGFNTRCWNPNVAGKGRPSEGQTILYDLNDDAKDNFEKVPFYTAAGQTERSAKYSKTVDQSDCHIVLAKAKTHGYYITTQSIKLATYGSVVVEPNVFGDHSRSQWYHRDYFWGHKSMARLLKLKPPDIVVIDGRVGMQGNGPTRGEPVELDWVIASTNAVEADALGAWLIGFEPEDIGYLYFAHHEHQLGKIDLNKLEIVGHKNWRKLRQKIKPASNNQDLLDWKNKL